MAEVGLGALAHASAGEVASFLGDVEAVALVEAVRAATDEQIHAIAHDAERCSSVVVGVMQRIGDLAVPTQVEGLDVRVQWECADHPGASGAVHLRDGAAKPFARGGADVVVRGTLRQLLRLVAGQLDVAVAHLGDQLGIEGDGRAALALAALFAADGTAPVTGTPVDPRDIAPLDISTALVGVTADHLRSVMASDIRDVILDEIFARMPGHVNGRKAAGARITVGFRLTGRPDGEVDRYVLRLSDGQATVLAGEAADSVDRDDRDATVTCDAHDFLRLVTGHLSVVSGVLRGQLRVRGDKAAALRLNAAFDIPSAVA